MTYSVRILADSIAQGVRITTFEATFPRFILAEVNTHREFSRNSASSRAIPVERRIEQVRENPFVPETFGKNQKGMQSSEVLLDAEAQHARESWLRAMEVCANEADYQRALGVHKQYANRLIELWGWHTAVITATQWKNFFALRTHKAAQPEMQVIAKLMKEAYVAGEPSPLAVGDWHLPYVTQEELMMLEAFRPPAGEKQEAWETLQLAMVKKSVVCCAAVSYERQLTERTLEQVQERHDGMVKSAHWSPFEHQAKVANEGEIKRHALYRHYDDGECSGFEPVRIGNFAVPWLQYRKTFENEAEWQGED